MVEARLAEEEGYSTDEGYSTKEEGGGYSRLVRAALEARCMDVKRLMQVEECDVDEPDASGDTALTAAIRSGSVEAVLSRFP
jgi:hypothetical protein